MFTCVLSTGYEPHKLLWHHPWSSVCLIYCTVLWISAGSSGVGLTKSQWDGRTPTDAKWLLNLPGCADRDPTSHQIVLKIHWQNARLLQVAFFFPVIFFHKNRTWTSSGVITKGFNRRQEPGTGSSVIWAEHLPSRKMRKPILKITFHHSLPTQPWSAFYLKKMEKTLYCWV